MTASPKHKKSPRPKSNGSVSVEKTKKQSTSIAELIEENPHICDSPEFFTSEEKQKTVLFTQAAQYVLEIKKSLSGKEISKFVSEAVLEYGLKNIPHKNFNNNFLLACQSACFLKTYPVLEMLTALALKYLRKCDDFSKKKEFIDKNFKKLNSISPLSNPGKKAAEMYFKRNTKAKNGKDTGPSHEREEDIILWNAFIHAKRLGWLEEDNDNDDD